MALSGSVREVDGNLVIYDSVGNRIVTVDMTNRKVTFPARAELELQAGAVVDLSDEVLQAADIALIEGSVLVGDAAGAAVALAAETDAQILVGDGTTLASVAVSGDVTIDNAGAVAIGATKVTLAMHANQADGTILVGNASNRPVAVTPSGDATMDNAGAFTLAVPKVSVLTETHAFGAFTDNLDATGQVDFAGTVPAGAVLLGSKVIVGAGFAGDVSAALTIGDGSDVDRYNTGTIDVFSTDATGVESGVPSGDKLIQVANSPTLTITTNADFTSVSAGSVTVSIYYLETV
jgi:hypothetical protein